MHFMVSKIVAMETAAEKNKQNQKWGIIWVEPGIVL